MKAKLKNFLSTKKGVFYALSVFFLTLCCIGGICCHFEKNVQNFCGTPEKFYVADTGLKCRQCGKNLKHKGFFCSENCREQYANEYHGDRYGKAICRNCGKEFVKPTACSYFCGEDCQVSYFSDLRLVSEAEEFRHKKMVN